MVKENKARTTAIITTCVVGLLVSFTGVIIFANNIDDTAKDAHVAIGIVKDEGCDVSKENEKDIIGIKKDVANTAEIVKEIRIEQSAMRIEQSAIRNDVTYIRAALEK